MFYNGSRTLTITEILRVYLNHNHDYRLLIYNPLSTCKQKKKTAIPWSLLSSASLKLWEHVSWRFEDGSSQRAPSHARHFLIDKPLAPKL